jgi:hypothetical protein
MAAVLFVDDDRNLLRAFRLIVEAEGLVLPAQRPGVVVRVQYWCCWHLQLTRLGGALIPMPGRVDHLHDGKHQWNLDEHAHDGSKRGT